jgi:hypothetical protein
MARGRAHGFGIVAALAVALAPAGARAQDDEDVTVRKLKFAEKGKNLVVSGSFTDVFDQELLEQLSSGFATTIVVRAYVYEKDGKELPVAYAAATYRVVYDLWDEVYSVKIRDGAGEREVEHETRAEALKAATTMVDLPVGRLTDVPVKTHHYVGVIVEVNPVSKELLAEVRRWITKPRGGQEAAGNSSFFGSFVSIFVNPKIAEADRTLRFKSQTFYRVPR